MRLHVDEVVIINLKRCPDRKAEIEFRCNKAGITEYKVLEAIDGDNLSLAYLKSKGIQVYGKWVNKKPEFDQFNNYYHRPILKGEIACTLSHVKAWEYMVNNNLSRMLLLEDDACFRYDEFIPFVNDQLGILDKKYRNWDLLYLGRKALQQDKTLPEVHINIPGYSWQSHAYILQLSGAHKLLAGEVHKSIIPIDEYLPVMNGSHVRFDLLNNWDRCEQLNSYTVDPLMIYQNPIYGISEIEIQ